MYMNLAQELAKNATCIRAQVGVVAVKNNVIIGKAFNTTIPGSPQCSHPVEETNYAFRINAPKLPDTPHYVIHAEANLIASAARNYTALQDSTLYTTLAPCETCAGLIILSGIRTVVVHQLFRSDTGITILKSGGLNVIYE